MFEENQSEPRKRERKKNIAKDTAEKIEDEKITRRLNNIYKDDNGKMPDMSHIRKAHGESFFAGLFKFLFSLAILSALVWGGFMFLNTTKQFADSQVDIKIIGPQDFTIGATTTYQIVLKNSQTTALNNVTLAVTYPAGFNFITSSMEAQNIGKTQWNLNSLKANEEQTLQITGKMFSSLDEKKSWRVALNYTPENMKSELQKIQTLDIQASATPISLSITGLDKVSLDNEVAYAISVESKDATNLDKLNISPIFPTNFVLTTSSLPFKNNGWMIPAITSSTDQSKYIIKFSGKFTTTTDETVNIKVQAKLSNDNSANMVLAESNIQSQVIKNALIINTAINGSLTDFSSKPGETLNFSVSLKNFGKEDISKAQIKLIIDAPSIKKQSILDWSQIKDVHDGDITGSQISDTVRRATLSWGEKKISDLKKIKSGNDLSMDFQLPIKATDKVAWNQIENNNIKITTELTFTDSAGAAQVLAGNPINIILNSDTALSRKNEVSAGEKGREYHDITWIINNTFHPLKDIAVSADIYGDITWIGPSSTSAGTIKFDPSTKHLVWNIPEMTDNTDVLTLPFSITINKKDPTQNTLVSKINFTATDVVSGNKIELSGDEVKLQ